MGDLIFKRYDNMIRIDERMGGIQTKAAKLSEQLEEYKIAMQTLEVNILEDVLMAQKAKQQELEREDYSKLEIDYSLHCKSFENHIYSGWRKQ